MATGTTVFFHNAEKSNQLILSRFLIAILPPKEQHNIRIFELKFGDLCGKFQKGANSMAYAFSHLLILRHLRFWRLVVERPHFLLSNGSHNDGLS